MITSFNCLIIICVFILSNTKGATEGANLKNKTISFSQKKSSKKDRTFLTECKGEVEHLTLTSAHNTYKKGNLMCARVHCNLTKKLIGLMLFQKIHPKKETLSIIQIYIDKNYQRQKIGTVLINTLSDKYEPKLINVATAPSAADFYKKLGFKEIDHEGIRLEKKCVAASPSQ